MSNPFFCCLQKKPLTPLGREQTASLGWVSLLVKVVTSQSLWPFPEDLRSGPGVTPPLGRVITAAINTVHIYSCSRRTHHSPGIVLGGWGGGVCVRVIYVSRIFSQIWWFTCCARRTGGGGVKAVHWDTENTAGCQAGHHVRTERRAEQRVEFDSLPVTQFQEGSVNSSLKNVCFDNHVIIKLNKHNVSQVIDLSVRWKLKVWSWLSASLCCHPVSKLSWCQTKRCFIYWVDLVYFNIIKFQFSGLFVTFLAPCTTSATCYILPKD